MSSPEESYKENKNMPDEISPEVELSAEKAKKYYYEGETFRQQGNINDAILNYKWAVKNDPKNPDYYHAVAKAYQMLAKSENSHGLYVLSMENLRKACEMAPDNASFHDAKLDLALKAGFVEELLKEYKELSEKNPENKFYKDYLKKIGVANMISISDVKKTVDAKKNLMIKILVDYILPLSGCILVVAGYMVKNYLNENDRLFVYSGFMLNIGAVLLFMFLVVKFLGYLRLKS